MGRGVAMGPGEPSGQIMTGRGHVGLQDSGYPHDGRTDKNLYRHDRRTDKDFYSVRVVQCFTFTYGKEC